MPSSCPPMLGPKFRFPGTFVRPGAPGSANLESVSQPSLPWEAHRPFPIAGAQPGAQQGEP